MVKNLAVILASLFAFAVIFGGLYMMRPEPSIDGIPSENNTLITDMLAQLDRQAEVDEMLLAELNSGAYTFEEPLVVPDPYGMSPLTALVLFTSDEPVNISIHVPGKTKLADVDFVFDGYNMVHQIPVYGLYPGMLNKVELTAVTQGKETKRITLEVQTDPLPPELEKNIILTDVAEPDKYQEGLNFTFSQKTAFDVNGNYRWFYNDFVMEPSTIYNYNGNIILAKGETFEGDLLLYEVNELGKVVTVYYSPYGVHHDITSINGKNLLVTGSHGETIEDFIYEVDTLTGEIRNKIDLKNILQRTRVKGSTDYSTTDWFHNNAVVYENGSIIISGRHQSATVKLSWPEGKIEWVLSNHEGWNSMLHQYLLEPIGSNFEWPYDQHAPEILPDYDNNPDTIDILLFDNGNSRFILDKEVQRAVANHEIVEPELYSRMVQYRINEKLKTVEQIWQFGKELGEPYYSSWRSDANVLSNGNRLGTFDREIMETASDYNTNFIEVSDQGAIIWEAYSTSTDALGTFSSYRLERLPIYTAAANDLKIGTPARNLIPEDKLP